MNVIAFQDRNLLCYTWNCCDKVSEIYKKKGKKHKHTRLRYEMSTKTKFINKRVLSSLTFVTKPAEQFGEKHSHLMAVKNS